MDILIKILLLIALASFIYLIYSLVLLIKDLRISLSKANNTLDSFSNEVKTLSPKVSLMIDDLRDLKVKVNESLTQFDNLQSKTIISLDDLSQLSKKATVSLEMIESRTEKFIEVLDPIEKLFKGLFGKVLPIINYSNIFVNAISKGIQVFTNRIAK